MPRASARRAAGSGRRARSEHGRRAGTRLDTTSSLSFSGGAARGGHLLVARLWRPRGRGGGFPRRGRGGGRAPAATQPPSTGSASGQASTSPRGYGSSASHSSTLIRRTPAAATSKRPSPSGITRTMRATVPIDVRTSPPPTSLPRSMSTTPNSGTSAARQSSTSWRYRGSKTLSGSSSPGSTTLPRGNIGTRIGPFSIRDRARRQSARMGTTPGPRRTRPRSAGRRSVPAACRRC